jgi:hypothetical protein
MKRATQTASKRKPKTRVITDAPRAVEVAAAAQISVMSERKSEDRMNEAAEERRAARKGHDAEGRPVRKDETAPGERSDGPYGDSEPGTSGTRPGT